MKKLLSLSIFVFLFMFAFLASTKAFAKEGNGGLGFNGSVNVGDDNGGDDSSNDDDSDSSDDNGGDDSDDSSNDDDSSSALQIEVDIFTDMTIVKVEMNDRKSSFTTDSKTEAEIVADILAKYPALVQADVEAALNVETEDRSSRPQDSSGVKKPLFPFLERPQKTEDNSGSGNSENRMRKLPAEEVLNRFQGAIKHIEKFILRLEGAIATSSSAGNDTTVAASFLAAAKVDLSEAKAHWQEAKDAWDAGGVNAKAEIKIHLEAMKMEIKSSFENLKLTIKALKELRDNTGDDNDDDNSDDNSGSNE